VGSSAPRTPPAPDDPERLTCWRELGREVIAVESTLRDIDRNLDTGHDLGAETEILPALQAIFHDREHPSRLVLPIVPRQDLFGMPARGCSGLGWQPGP
jgi:hypothetical protein